MSFYPDPEIQKRLVPIGRLMGEKFNSTHWNELGLLTGSAQLVHGHSRLLRSLSFGDDDYPAACLEVLGGIVRANPANLQTVEDYIAEHFEGAIGMNISTKPGSGPSIRFTPSVFEVPTEPLDPRLVAVMMPFTPEFTPVYAAIRQACDETNWFSPKRADDIWDHSTVIQDVFSLIFRSRVVICDYSGRNPNVFYEAGIAHTLGKTVIPLTQSKADIPFDVSHHRYLSYLNNREGLASMKETLRDRLISIEPINAAYF